MWILSWKKYALSKFATFVSVLGALMRYAGVTCLVSSLIPAGLIFISVGVVLHFGVQRDKNIIAILIFLIFTYFPTNSSNDDR